jgi:hypothetical protein
MVSGKSRIGLADILKGFKMSFCYLVLPFLVFPLCIPAVSAGQNLIDHPSLDKIGEGLSSWESTYPDRIDVTVEGESLMGQPIYLAKITDEKVPDKDKQVVLITTSHAGSELTSPTSTMHFIKWLIGDAPSAEKIRKGVITLIMPCNNPDGYNPVGEDNPYKGERFSRRQNNAENINIYGAWFYEGPERPSDNPEGVAIFKVTEKYQPDVAVSVHGQSYRGGRMWESTGFSWVDFHAHSFQPIFLEKMRRAAEDEGFQIFRPGQFSGLIKVNKAPDDSLRSHYYYISTDAYTTQKGQKVKRPMIIMNFLYNRYHTLATIIENAYVGSFVAQTRKMLEMGLERWELGEFYPGYPINQVAGWGDMSVCAYGQTAQQRRTSRVELWRKNNQIKAGTCGPKAGDRAMAYCATTVKSAKKWLDNIGWSRVVKKLEKHPVINADAIKAFNTNPDVKFTRFSQPQRRMLGYNTGKITDEPIVNGLSLRLFIPYVDAEVYDVSIDGKPVEKSEVDGYMLIRNPGTILQFNIPPDSVGDLHIVSCKWTSPAKRKLGFSESDWELGK